MTENVNANVASPVGFSAKQARRWEYGIIGFCLVSMACIFQPFSQFLFSAGCIGVVVGGLAFNLVPHCKPGATGKSLRKTALIVVIVFVIVVAFALLSAWGYGIYLKMR